MFDLRQSDEQELLVQSVRDLLARHCTSEHVRAAAATGFDAELWGRLVDLGLVDMTLPPAIVGGGAELLTLAVACVALGEHAAPVPIAEVSVAARLLSALDSDVSRATLATAREGALVTVALDEPVNGRLRAVPFGRVASHVLFHEAGSLRVTADPPPSEASGAGTGIAAADRSSVGSDLIAAGPSVAAAVQRARSEWRALAAATLAGIAKRAAVLGTDYAKDRHAFGVPIATFQTLAHSIANVAMDVDGAELLAWEAAWAADHDPGRFDSLAAMSFAFSAEAAERAATTSLHIHGGYGFMLEYDIQLYFRAAKALALTGGGAAATTRELADLLKLTSKELP